MDKKKEQVYLKDRLRNCNNLRIMINEGWFPGKYTPVNMELMQFADDLEADFTKRLNDLSGNRQQRRKSSRSKKK